MRNMSLAPSLNQSMLKGNYGFQSSDAENILHTPVLMQCAYFLYYTSFCCVSSVKTERIQHFFTYYCFFVFDFLNTQLFISQDGFQQQTETLPEPAAFCRCFYFFKRNNNLFFRVFYVLHSCASKQLLSAHLHYISTCMTSKHKCHRRKKPWLFDSH